MAHSLPIHEQVLLRMRHLQCLHGANVAQETGHRADNSLARTHERERDALCHLSQQWPIMTNLLSCLGLHTDGQSGSRDSLLILVQQQCRMAPCA